MRDRHTDEDVVTHNHSKDIHTHTHTTGTGPPCTYDGGKRTMRAAFSRSGGFTGVPARRALRRQVLSRNQTSPVCSYLTGWEGHLAGGKINPPWEGWG